MNFFFDSNGEIWVVWDRMRSIVPTWRSAFKNPHLFQNIEETLQAPGSLAGKACARVHGSDAANDGAGESGNKGQLGFAKREIFARAGPAWDQRFSRTGKSTRKCALAGDAFGLATFTQLRPAALAA